MPRWTPWERFLIALLAAVVLYQLLVPPLVGLANNGDFGKVAGRFSLVQPGGIAADNFIYFVSRWERDPAIYWNSGILSSELILASIAVGFNWLFGRDGSFDIRLLGLVHSVVWIAAFAFVLPALRRLPPFTRRVLPLIIIFIIADVCYVACFNSFYMDAAALVFLFAAVAAAIRLSESPALVPLCCLGIAQLLLAASKPQHSLAAVPFWVFMVATAKGEVRKLAWAIVFVTLAIVVWIQIRLPANYKDKALYNVIFYELTARSPNPLDDLRALGLKDEHRIAVGTHAFEDKSPATDPRWLDNFYRQASFGRVVLFYARHPARTLGRLWRVLSADAPRIRADNLANRRREDGFPPGSMSHAFRAWSTAKSRAIAACPVLLLLLYLIALCSRSTLHFALLGILAFLVAALADVLDNGRHLLLFHAATDALFCFVLGAALSWLERRFKPAAP